MCSAVRVSIIDTKLDEGHCISVENDYIVL
jgi:hypothetical protein